MCCMAGDQEKTYCCYSDVASSGGGSGNHANLIHHTHLLHSFDPNPEIYNLTAGMEMIGFPPPSKTHQDNNPFYHHHGFTKQQSEALIVSQDSPSSSAWSHPHHRLIVDDPSLRCVFPCEENERPSQGLSLSLNSTNPSSIGLQSFELRAQQQHDDPRFGPSSSRSVNIPPLTQEHSYIRNSKYMGPAQELLNEFCNLGTNQIDSYSSKLKVHKASACQDEDAIKKQSLFSLDRVQLQIRKTKLLQMLEEVDRRYKHYCDQMKAVVSSFETVAGSGAATVYSALASKAMSRHFRCLRDGMVAQIKATKKAIGEKDATATAPGSVRGETPRLRLIDQTLRQQRALQQMSMMESHPWRPQRGLPERSVSILRAWLFEHFLHPYPSDVDKHILARQTGLSRSQVSNWFINARVRLWKPMVEEMYLEELKESAGMENAVDTCNLISGNNSDSNQSSHYHYNPSGLIRNDDQKPTHDQLARIDSDCLSSIINTTATTTMNNNNNNNSNPDHKKDSQIKNKAMILNDHHQNLSFCKFGESMELDFSSYNPQSGVSLTLGLHQHQHQHNIAGLSLGGYSQTSVQNSSLFYPSRDDHMETTAQYSLLDGSDSQNLPYRNLMGAQLLHDLAG